MGLRGPCNFLCEETNEAIIKKQDGDFMNSLDNQLFNVCKAIYVLRDMSMIHCGPGQITLVVVEYLVPFWRQGTNNCHDDAICLL